MGDDFIFFNKKYIVLFLIFLFYTEFLLGQSVSQYWNTSDGLSNNWVSDITQDEDGHIWVTTQYGLNRIDPISFEIKRYLIKGGLIDEKIMGLLVDDAGLVWGSTVGQWR